MDDYLKEREIQRKREYHREWRKNHPESVKAAQLRYWTKIAAKMQNQESTCQTNDNREE